MATRRISSFAFLNTTQFLVTLNDSIFRLIVAYALIDLLGVEHSNKILSISAALFVAPFLLFSMPSGQMADRFSKRTVIIWTLWAEILFMICGFFGIMIKDQYTAYFALFLIALQSAVFNPSKYAIIPEIESQDRLSKANGYLTLCSYLAVILGTFLASFISDITNRNYLFVIFLCFIFSIIALFTGYGIEKTPVKNPKKKINLLFIVQVFKNLKIASRYPHLLLAILATSYFLFTAAYTQLNLIPFGIQSLKITDVQTGYVYLAAALGLGVGSILVALLSGKTVELGLSIWGGFGVAFSYILLYSCQYNLFASCIMFFSVGMHGGLFIVPLDTFIQYASPEEDRGSIVAASLFTSFLGVLIAAGALSFWGDVLGLRAATGFLIIGLMTLTMAFVVLLSLPDYVTRLVAVIMAKFFFTLDVDEDKLPEKGLLVCKEKHLSTQFSLVFSFQKIRFVKWTNHPVGSVRMFFLRMFNAVPLHLKSEEELGPESIQRLKGLIDDGYLICLFEDCRVLKKRAFKLSGLITAIKSAVPVSTHKAKIEWKSPKEQSHFHFFRIFHPTLSLRFQVIQK